MGDAEFQVRFREIQKRFVTRMEGDREKILHTVAQLQDAIPYEEQLRLFHVVIHQYSGSGQSFGFADVSKAARRLEIVLQSINDREALLFSLTEITSLAQELVNAFDAAIQSDAQASGPK